ncbi:hypothetical protein HZH66_005862 [Vespula vulgaris]|uniref:Uncharacterized protein n=1 Tax=Vespula vulgaris TaxID=7454 RepID=A0A834K5X7_VESVU|nr:hypothetical protein HZH66_005862 [Vespula vulgaris]
MTAFHRRHLRKREERRNGIQKRGTVKRIESVFKSVRRAVYTDVFSLEKKREYTETLDAKNDDAIISPRLLPASKYEKANSPTFPSRRHNETFNKHLELLHRHDNVIARYIFNAWNPCTIRELNAGIANGRNDRNKRTA